MQGKLLYEYAIVRIVPRVEREEFVNAGVIVYCRQKRWVKMLYQLDEHKVKALHPDADTDLLEQYLAAFHNVCAGTAHTSPIAALDAASRFRWLTAVRSTMIQTSRVHPGFCTEPEHCLHQLFREQVL